MASADRNGVRLLLTAVGLMFVVIAVFYNEYLLGFFDPDPPLEAVTVDSIRRAQMAFAGLGVVLICVSEGLIKRFPSIDRATRKAWLSNVLLVVVPASALLVTLELGLSPFNKGAQNLTTIYMKDESLGWRLRPGAEDVWGGVRVRINDKGLRGPEVDYAESKDTLRILYLGDSVTFGYRLDTPEQAFPYRVEAILEARLGIEIETINAGVGGYSPWQERIYLEEEGIKYAPDLVVLSFVLNDVTEQFGLRRFGGQGVGWQLQNTVSGTMERMLRGSSIWYFVRQASARLRFGENVAEGARRQESLEVEDLAINPDASHVREAWEKTLSDVDGMVQYCGEHDIPVVLVVWPFVFQFSDPVALSAPQQTLIEFAGARGVEVIDLLPPLAKATADGLEVEDLFLDEDHPSEQGSLVVAGILAARLARIEPVLSFVAREAVSTGE